MNGNNYKVPVYSGGYITTGKTILLNYLKVCGKCGIIRPADCYYKSSKSKDGLQGYCNECRRDYQRTYMNKRYKDPDFYEKQLNRNSLNRIKNKPAGRSNELLGCPDWFYLEWLNFQRREHEIVTGFKIKVEERDHVLSLKHFENDPRCYEWVNIRPIERSDNRRKSAKFTDYNLYKNQLRKANGFIRQLVRKG